MEAPRPARWRGLRHTAVNRKGLHGHRHDEHSRAGVGEQITEQKTSHMPVPQHLPVRPIVLVGHHTFLRPVDVLDSERRDTHARLYLFAVVTFRAVCPSGV
jgi:hypothetical protein